MSNQYRMTRLSAFVAWGCAATFIFGFALLLTCLMPYMAFRNDPALAVQFAVDNHGVLSVWNLVIYLVFGVLLTVLVLDLHGRLCAQCAKLSQLAAAFGLVWVGLVLASGMVANVGLSRVVETAAIDEVHAQSLWLSMNTIQEGLGGGNEIVGGLWLLVVSLAARQTRLYPPLLCRIGSIAGIAGVVSTVPVLAGLGALFGLLSIVWFVYLGVVMLREAKEAQSEGARGNMPSS